MRTIFFVPVILVIVLAAILSTAWSALAQRAADECITKPGSAAPQGGHWYFRVNRSDHRHCWYVGSEGAKLHTSVRPVEPPTPPGLTSPVPVPTERPRKAKPGEVDVGRTEAPVDFATRWPDLQERYVSVARESSSASSSYIVERVSADSEDDMPMIWPTLTTTDRAVASSPSLSAANSEHILALLGGVMVFASVIVRSLFKPAAAGRLGQSGLGDQQRFASNANFDGPLAALSRPNTKLHTRRAGQMTANGAPTSAMQRATAGRSRVALQRDRAPGRQA